MWGTAGNRIESNHKLVVQYMINKVPGTLAGYTANPITEPMNDLNTVIETAATSVKTIIDTTKYVRWITRLQDVVAIIPKSK